MQFYELPEQIERKPGIFDADIFDDHRAQFIKFDDDLPTTLAHSDFNARPFSPFSKQFGIMQLKFVHDTARAIVERLAVLGLKRIAPGKPRTDDDTTQAHSIRNASRATVTNSDIARRAYELYEQRGGEHGRDLDDWLIAEHELRDAVKSTSMIALGGAL